MLAPPHPPLIRDGDTRLSTPACVIAIALLAALMLIVAALHRGAQPASRPAAHPPRATLPARIAPTEPPPVVAPIVYADMTPDEARADNTARPFSGETPKPAPRFLFSGSDADRAAARTCLAAAEIYEAGDDAKGEQAVAQVVLNRLRHPAFPKTVCGVVFQGAERSTGCQFTFTCDGALDRPPNPAAWDRARKIADAALSGTVDKAVGPATHYHADYVVPYWRGSLDKLSQVGAHIFYRWPGWWGSAAALTGKLQPLERLDRRLVALAGPEAVAAAGAPIVDPGAPPPPPLVALAIDGVPKPALKGAIVRAKDEAAAQYVLQLDGSGFAGSWAVTGFSICAEHPDCLVLGWTSEADVPRAVPVPPQAMRTLAFMYRKSSALEIAQPSWDCRRYPRSQHGQCLAGTGPAARAIPAAGIRPSPAPASR